MVRVMSVFKKVLVLGLMLGMLGSLPVVASRTIEYNEYISAKEELDDLKYLYTVAVANDISSKNEK